MIYKNSSPPLIMDIARRYYKEKNGFCCRITGLMHQQLGLYWFGGGGGIYFALFAALKHKPQSKVSIIAHQTILGLQQADYFYKSFAFSIIESYTWLCSTNAGSIYF